jgi:hypothetical protein
LFLIFITNILIGALPEGGLVGMTPMFPLGDFLEVLGGRSRFGGNIQAGFPPMVSWYYEK